MKFKRAETESEKRQCYRIRHQVYCVEEGYLPCNNGLEEYDEFDRTAVHFIGFEANRAVATTRLIVPGKIPMEELFDLSGIPEGVRFVESSRTAVMKDFRSPAAMLELLKIKLSYALHAGFTHIIYAANADIPDLLTAQMIVEKARKDGFEDQQVRVHRKQSDDFPIIIDRSGCEEMKYPNKLRIWMKIGSTFIGDAAFYPKVRMTAIPMILDLGKIPEIYRRKFFAVNPYHFKER